MRGTAAGVFVAVSLLQLWLVARIGTDIPFQDQWGIEGQWLYPKWLDGTLRAAELGGAFNEHRILWTHLLNLGLFTANGQWDPLVQLVAIVVLRAGCAAGIAAYLVRSGAGRPAWIAAGVAVAFLPHLAWHNVIWGIESHAYLALGLGALTLGLLCGRDPSWGRLALGAAAGIAGLFAMGPAALVPGAVLGLVVVRCVERRGFAGADRNVAAVAAALLVLGFWLRVDVPEHAGMRAPSVADFIATASRILAWPHDTAPGGVVMNLPLVVLVGARMLRRRRAAGGEDFVVGLAGWSAAIALATAWVRGGSGELAGGVPSRYVDFLVALPAANVWATVQLAREAVAAKRIVRVAAGGWLAFLLVGWAGASAAVMRGLVLPRAADRDAPVRLAQAFQRDGDPAVFAGQPLLYLPHPNLEVVRAVLADPRLAGKLPPSLQPQRPLGPLSRGVRWLLGPERPAQ